MASEFSIFNQDDYIQEGANPALGVIVVACTVGEDYDTPKNRILVRKGETWLEFGSSGEAVVSVDATVDGMAYVLGENGSVIRFDWQAPTTEELRASRVLFANDTVARIGPLRRVRVVGDDVICGGSGGQCYQLGRSHFEELPNLTIGGKELTIEDLIGSSVRDFVAVTSDGLGASFNGSKWRDLELPTNASLSSVCELRDGRYAIAGRQGTMLIGKHGQWSVADPIDPERNYWGVAAHNGLVYAAYLGGIDVFDGADIRPFAVPRGLEHTVLRSGPDGIWSFAGKTIGLITEDGWRTVVAQ